MSRSIAVLASLLVAWPAISATWLERANAEPGTRTLSNPYQGQDDAIKAGAKLFKRHCSACHGNSATGVGRAPSLHSPAVETASPGALYWLLRNGSLRRGMPSWSHLPPQQLWQLVTWIQTLPRGTNNRR